MGGDINTNSPDGEVVRESRRGWLAKAVLGPWQGYWCSVWSPVIHCIGETLSLHFYCYLAMPGSIYDPSTSIRLIQTRITLWTQDSTSKPPEMSVKTTSTLMIPSNHHYWDSPMSTQTSFLPQFKSFEKTPNIYLYSNSVGFSVVG